MDRHETRIQRPPETADPDGIYERYCPQCGKTFMCWAPREWCYRINYRFFCSWTCYREAERHVRPHAGVRVEKVLEDAKKERQHNAHYDPTTAIEQTKKIIARKERGMNNAEIAAELGLTPSVVAQRLTKYGRALGWRPMTKKEAGMNGVRARKKRDLSASAEASPLSGETGRKRDLSAAAAASPLSGETGRKRDLSAAAAASPLSGETGRKRKGGGTK